MQSASDAVLAPGLDSGLSPTPQLPSIRLFLGKSEFVPSLSRLEAIRGDEPTTVLVVGSVGP